MILVLMQQRKAERGFQDGIRWKEWTEQPVIKVAKYTSMRKDFNIQTKILHCTWEAGVVKERFFDFWDFFWGG